ncbi:MAG: hypothetical protein JWL73_893 [Actinomycetia bacterium]|nr:hypothetical protein [Actinomycetes bacterium]
MSRRAATRRVVRSIVATMIVAVGIVVAAGYTPGGATPAFAAQSAGTDHRAVVTVDTGSLVRTVCVHFTADSITGAQALDLAGVDPVYRGYGTTGAAVCSLCNQGCPADSTCLTCGGANYWQYYRAPAGSANYVYSPAGAGATQVHDGDVEAWKWGNRQMPSHVSFESVCGSAPQVIPTTLQPQTTTAAPAHTTSATSPAGAPATGTSGGSGGPAATTAPRSGSRGGTSATGSSTTLPGVTASSAPGTATTAATGATVTTADGRASTTTASGGTKRALGDPIAPKLATSKGGGSPLPLILVAILVLALAVGGLFLRLRRNRPASS